MTATNRDGIVSAMAKLTEGIARLDLVDLAVRAMEATPDYQNLDPLKVGIRLAQDALDELQVDLAKITAGGSA